MRRNPTLELAATGFAGVWASGTALLFSMIVPDTPFSARCIFASAIGGLAVLATGIACWRLRPLRGEQDQLIMVGALAMLIFAAFVGIGSIAMMSQAFVHAALPQFLAMAAGFLILVVPLTLCLSLIPTMLGALVFSNLVSRARRSCLPRPEVAP